MRLTRLTTRGVRNLAPLDLQPGPGLNLVLGNNGAGKTSLLEAVHLLAYGRSFRGRVRDGLVQTMAKSAVRTMGTTAGREILRGVLGGIFGGKKGR